MSASTRPARAGVSFEAYCESIGVDLPAARSATVSRALLATILRGEQALERAQLDAKRAASPWRHTRRQAQARRSAGDDE